jgi:hypothetical protein
VRQVLGDLAFETVQALVRFLGWFVHGSFFFVEVSVSLRSGILRVRRRVCATAWRFPTACAPTSAPRLSAGSSFVLLLGICFRARRTGNAQNGDGRREVRGGGGARGRRGRVCAGDTAPHGRFQTGGCGRGGIHALKRGSRECSSNPLCRALILTDYPKSGDGGKGMGARE